MPRHSTNRADRPQRTPLGTRKRLTCEQRPGDVRRWVNDEPGRVERFKAAGYETVTDDLKVGDPRADTSTQMGSAVTADGGGGVRMVLMEIPEGFYREDQAAKQQHVDRSEDGLRPQGIKGKQYGGLHGSLKITRRGETRTLEADGSEHTEK